MKEKVILFDDDGDTLDNRRCNLRHKLPKGVYYTVEEAEAVYKTEAKRLQGEFAAHLSREQGE